MIMPFDVKITCANCEALEKQNRELVEALEELPSFLDSVIYIAETREVWELKAKAIRIRQALPPAAGKE